ncbi:MAG: hypothetical protein ABI699_09295 [Caldimonas sp.]
MSDDLQALVLPEEYRASRAHLFPSPQSLTWFVRQHKASLVAAGALTVIGGRHRLHPDKTDAVLVEAGKQAAQKAVA